MRGLWLQFVEVLPLLAVAVVTSLILWGAVRVTIKGMRHLWAEELRKYGPEIVKAETARRERVIADLQGRNDKLTRENALLREKITNLRKLQAETAEWLR